MSSKWLSAHINKDHSKKMDSGKIILLDYNRRLCQNYELTLDSAEEMVKLATIKLFLKKI